MHKNFGEISDDFMLLTKYESSNTTNASLFESRGVQTPMDIARTVLDSVVNTKTKSVLTSEINESRIGKEMGKWDYGGEDFEESKRLKARFETRESHADDLDRTRKQNVLDAKRKNPNNPLLQEVELPRKERTIV